MARPDGCAAAGDADVCVVVWHRIADTGRLQEPPEGHWRPVALAMRATPAQVRVACCTAGRDKAA